LSLGTAPGPGEGTALARPVRRASAGLRWFALVTVIVLYGVVVLGFLDTATGSALGCGRSFPLCDGRFLPEPTLTSVVEWTHRVVSAFAGVLVLALVIWAWVEARVSAHVRVLGLVGLGFLVVESAVGAAAVLVPEPDALVALHLGIALTSFGAIAALMFVLWRLPAMPSGAGAAVPRRVRVSLWAILVFTYAIVYLGALVAQVNAGTACGGWPLCQGALVPAHWSWPVLLDYAHRIVALAALAVFWAQTRVLRVVREDHPNLYRGGHLAFGLVVLTAVSGGWLALSHVALAATLVHVGLVTLLFGTVSYLCAFAVPASRRAAEVRP
jgi:heme a synthase